MNLAEFLIAQIQRNAAKVQILPHCLEGAQLMKAKRGQPAYTRITFATEHMTPNDAAYWTTDLHDTVAKPAKIGLVLWVSLDEYDRAAAERPQEKP